MGDWTLQWGTPQADNGNGVAVDSNGEIYLTGHTSGSLDGQLGYGNRDMFLAKRNAVGELLWTRLWGNGGANQGYGVAVAPNGDVYVAGDTTGHMDGQTSLGGYDAFVTKWTGAGVKGWTRLMTTSDTDNGYAVAVSPSGEVYVTGGTRGNMDGQTNAGNQDAFLTKWNSTGGHQWTRLWGSTSGDFGRGVAVSSSGDIYVAGLAGGEFDGQTNSGVADMFVTKWNAAGVKQWTRLAGSSGYDGAYAVAASSVGDVYVAGYAGGDLDGQTLVGGTDAALIKWSANGVKQWTRLWGSTQSDYAYGVDVAPDGSAYVAGHTQAGFDGQPFVGSVDVFLTKWTTNGSKEWTKMWGSPDLDIAGGVAVTPTGQVVVGGYTAGTLTESFGAQDLFISRLKSVDSCPPVEGTYAPYVLSPPLSYDPGTVDCPLCPAGMFANATGLTACYGCPDGTANFLTGQSVCNATFPVILSVSPATTPVSGGTVVDIRGGNFNSTTVPLWRSDTGTRLLGVACTTLTPSRINCTTPVFPRAENISVLIETDQASSLYVPPTMEVFSTTFPSFAPRSGPSTGETSVVVRAQAMAAKSPQLARCRFGNLTVAAQSVSYSSITCATPIVGLGTGVHDVAVSGDGQLWFDVSGGKYTTYEGTLASISPVSGLSSGGTIVTVSGSGIVNAGDVPQVNIDPSGGTAAKVVSGAFTANNDSVAAIVVTTPSFTVPPLAAGTSLTSTVTVAPNGAQYLGQSVQFELYEAHGLSAVSPSTAPVGVSGIELTLAPDSGKTFANTSSEIRVRIRDSGSTVVTVTGTWHSGGTRVTARLPSFGESGRGDVSVALNGQQWSAWRELTLFRVDSVSPVWGPTTGGTVVTVAGDGFTSTGTDVKCRFGGTTAVAATVVTSTQITCTSPSGLSAGNVVVAVTTNGNNYTDNTEAVLPTGALPTLTSVHPPESPLQLPVAVTITGAGFVNTSSIKVRFNAQVVDGVFVSSSSITCTAPSLPAGTAEVQVSLNGQLSESQFTAAGQATFVTVEPTVDGFSPASVPLSGGTTVTMSGNNIMDAPGVAGSLRVWIKSTPATYLTVSGTPVVFTTPSLSGKVTLGGSGVHADVGVEVSTNGGATWSSSGRVVRAYTQPVLNASIPNVMPLGGGTTLMLTGRFAQVTDATRVRYQDGEGWQSSLVSATTTSDTITATMSAYKRTSGAVATLDVWVALNGIDWVDTGLKLTAYPDPVVSGVDPVRKDPGVNTQVVISGTGFIDTGYVQIQLGTGNIFTPTSVTATQIVFQSPASHAQGEYLVEVSLDGGQHWDGSSTGIQFKVLLETLVCPTNTDSILSTPTSITHCQCLPNFYRADGQAGFPCQECPVNAVCLGRLAQPVPQKGFYATGVGTELRFVQCAVASACLGGNSSACATGYKGTLCGTCDTGFYKLGDTCQQCRQGSGGTVVLLVILFVLYLFFVRRQVRVEKKKKTGKVAALAITHLQVMSTFGEYRLNWPSEVQAVFNTFSLANFNIDTAAPECSVTEGWTAETRFWITMMLPVMLAAGLMLRVLGQYLQDKWVTKHGDEFRVAHAQFCAPPDAQLPKWRFVLELVRYNVSCLFTESSAVDEETWRYLVNEMLFSMGLLYITLCTRVLEVFDCTEVQQGVSVMDVAPDVQCWLDGGMHARLVGPAVLFGLLYVLGTPAVFLGVMLNSRDAEKRRDESFQQRYSTIFNKYGPHFFWFEAMVLLRKAAVVGVKLFATTLPALQGLLGLVVLGGATFIQASYTPYKTSMQNNLESILLVESLLLLVAGMVFVTGSDAKGTQQWSNLTMVVAVSVIVVCVWYVGRDVWNGVQERHRESTADQTKASALEDFKAAVRPLLREDAHGKLDAIASDSLSVEQLEAAVKEVELVKDAKKRPAVQDMERAKKVVQEDEFSALLSVADESDGVTLLEVLRLLGTNGSTLRGRLNTISHRGAMALGLGKKETTDDEELELQEL